ncbi:hypothetical protein OC846_001283 [Tilletia horrida]|uniref:Sugar phosphate transporter domain-containing protein n=1 Tax=Tilletia horrida TaxID=155126 RepID=A0AAN6GTN1_9BASI|nr:hypothetical protein OC846_001283 [Tilletia horrida]KAK0569415.1 hypothetical protein OC861_000903 [Tilletia horrida]
MATLYLLLQCLLWYSTSSLNANTSQALLKPNKATNQAPLFPHPLTLTLAQFVFVHIGSSLCCSKTLLGQHRLSNLITPSWSKIWQVGQLSVFHVIGHLLGSSAVSRVPVSTVQTIKALSPLFTVLVYSSLFNVSYPFNTYFSLLPLTLGVMLACSGFTLTGDDVVGFSLALASTLVVVGQNIYSKKLMGGAGGQGEGKLDKLNIMFVSSGTSIALLLPSFVFSELPKFFSASAAETSTRETAHILYLLFANGVAHFTQNLFAFTVLSLVSPVTYSVASLFKRVFVIIVAILWFGQAVTALQWLGIVFTFGGLYLYNESKPGKVDEKIQRKERMQQLHLPLPNERQQAETDLQMMPLSEAVGVGPAAVAAEEEEGHSLSHAPLHFIASSGSQPHSVSEAQASARHRMLNSHAEPTRTVEYGNSSTHSSSSSSSSTIAGPSQLGRSASPPSSFVPPPIKRSSSPKVPLSIGVGVGPPSMPYGPSIPSPLRSSFVPSSPGASGPGRPHAGLRWSLPVPPPPPPPTAAAAAAVVGGSEPPPSSSLSPTPPPLPQDGEYTLGSAALSGADGASASGSKSTAAAAAAASHLPTPPNSEGDAEDRT